MTPHLRAEVQHLIAKWRAEASRMVPLDKSSSWEADQIEIIQDTLRRCADDLALIAEAPPQQEEKKEDTRMDRLSTSPDASRTATFDIAEGELRIPPNPRDAALGADLCLAAPTERGWQLIETAPKDGKEILCTWLYELPDGRKYWSQVMHVLSWFKDWYGEGQGSWSEETERERRE